MSQDGQHWEMGLPIKSDGQHWEMGRPNKSDRIEWSCHSKSACTVDALIGWLCVLLGYDWLTRSHLPCSIFPFFIVFVTFYVIKMKSQKIALAERSYSPLMLDFFHEVETVPKKATCSRDVLQDDVFDVFVHFYLRYFSGH